MSQLNLPFLNIPIPQTCLWEELNHQQKQLVVETLARLMIKATAPAGNPQEPAND
jgi:phenylpyruvate tautomerase PptA (4-oxalocrotonate tautomerase family)